MSPRFQQFRKTKAEQNDDSIHSYRQISHHPLLGLSIAADSGNRALPGKPITIIAPYGPKSDSDYYAHAIIKHIAPFLGNPAFVIEHQPGDSGSLATINLKAAKPDGYTLMQGRVATQAIRNVPGTLKFGTSGNGTIPESRHAFPIQINRTEIKLSHTN